jgi:lipopolysaccharide/colanic/teichoic acid biosynthesis glycosyltransferase
MIILFPLFGIIAILIKFTSNGPIFFIQKRVGEGNTDFYMYKFRTMYTNSEQQGSLTVGVEDMRITFIGYYLRKFKLDELPQLYNVLKGNMSMVGPRPELRKYVDLYTDEQKIVLSSRPGITDYASIKFKNENQLLAREKMPEEFYIKEIMPVKIELNKYYLANKNLRNYFYIIFNTLI